MSVTIQPYADSNVIEIHLTGKLSHEDYQQFVPLLDERISSRGKIRLLVVLHDFHGWTVGALWDDLKFDLHHFRDIERLALVGESKWEQGMAAFCKPFTTAKVKYFDQSQVDQADIWIKAA